MKGEGVEEIALKEDGRKEGRKKGEQGRKEGNGDGWKWM